MEIHDGMTVAELARELVRLSKNRGRIEFTFSSTSGGVFVTSQTTKGRRCKVGVATATDGVPDSGFDERIEDYTEALLKHIERTV